MQKKRGQLLVLLRFTYNFTQQHSPHLCNWGDECNKITNSVGVKSSVE